MVKLPTAEEVANFKSAVVTQTVLISGAQQMDSSSLLNLQGATDVNWGTTMLHFINCAFTFLVDGNIWMAVLNDLGNFHDSNITNYGLHDGLQQVFDRDGGQIVVDSAYKVWNAPFLVKSSNIDLDVFSLPRTVSL